MSFRISSHNWTPSSEADLQMQCMQLDGGAASQILPEAQGGVARMGTSGVERLLLMVTIVILPLDDHIPGVMGFSSLFITFGVLAVYVLVNRLFALEEVWLHPVFIAAYGFLGISSLIEFANPISNYGGIVRFALMIAGAIFVAALCRDRSALTSCLYGFIGAAVWLSILIIMTSYGTLGAMGAVDFDQASRIRVQAFKDMPVHANLNGLAFSCSQGALVALAFALGSVTPRRRLFLTISAFCFVASCLPMSRSGMAIGFLAGAAIFYAYGIRHMKEIMILALLGLSIFLIVPEAIWSRMAFSTEADKTDSRGLIYVSAYEHLSEYLVTGVGAGSCPEDLVVEHWSCVVHNSFLQVTINWGLVGLLSFVIIIWQAYCCLPRRSGRDELALGLLGIASSFLLLTPFLSEFYCKGFSLALGMLVASRSWIWPTGETQD